MMKGGGKNILRMKSVLFFYISFGIFIFIVMFYNSFIEFLQVDQYFIVIFFWLLVLFVSKDKYFDFNIYCNLFYRIVMSKKLF